MKKIPSESLCPCGSGQTYQLCCEVFHKGKYAPTAEKLMRSRFCAYYLKNTALPAGNNLAPSTRWTE